MSAGVPAIAGNTASVTVTTCASVAVFPAASVAVQVIVVTPTLNETAVIDVPAPVVAPVITYATVTPGALSVAIGLVMVSGIAQPVVATVVLCDSSTPAVMTGASLSSTVTSKLVVVTPQLLVAETTTVDTPMLKVSPVPVPAPDAVVAPEIAYVNVTADGPVAVAVYATTAVGKPASVSTVMSTGAAVNVGN